MSIVIVAVGPPVTFNQQPMAVVAVGGGVVGDAWSHVAVDLRCRVCQETYPMAEAPRALALTSRGAQVLPGYTEMCPHCYHEHKPGTFMQIEVCND